MINIPWLKKIYNICCHVKLHKLFFQTVITTNGKQRHHPDCKRGQSERRERKKQLARKRYKEKIFIGPHIEKWNRVKEELNFSLNYELAGYLLKQSVIFFNWLITLTHVPVYVWYYFRRNCFYLFNLKLTVWCQRS